MARHAPTSRRGRVVLAKPGLDGHDRGVRLVAQALRDAGFEVIYMGLFQTPEAIAEAALQEDADIVGLSVLSGTHLFYSQRLMSLLEQRGLRDRVKVVVGGMVAQKDIPRLRELGVAAVFPAGVMVRDVVQGIEAQMGAPAP
ncbi:MAG: cobalamin B12-binding domain-containing protein [Chloroflexi bacterium]|nr:cobalamin B12-binding domain-containing protein [Chloroflexota bacterium]